MMGWEDVKSSIITACGVYLAPSGYERVKSREAFEKSTKEERRGVYLTLVASTAGNYRLRLWCGVRNNAIEDRFHRTSGVEKKHRANYTTINIGGEKRWPLNTENEIVLATGGAEYFIRGSALPFLERPYSIQDYCDLLNTQPHESCTYHGNRENRCHYGLIAAKFAGDPRYAELKNIYSQYLRSTNKGFYYPRFERLVADLES